MCRCSAKPACSKRRRWAAAPGSARTKRGCVGSSPTRKSRSSGFSALRGSALGSSETVDDLLEHLVRLSSEDEVAPAEDVRGNRVYAHRACDPPVLIDDRVVATFLHGGAQVVAVESDPGAEAHDVVDLLETSAAFPVRFEERVMHLVELAVLTGKLRRAERAPRVDDDVARMHLEADRFRDRLQMRSYSVRPPAAEVCLARDAFRRRLRMQLERQPRQVDQSLALELLDSDRVDVAPGSNVVREDDQVDRLHLICPKHHLIRGWHKGCRVWGAHQVPASTLGIQEVRIWQTRRLLS